MTDTAGHHWFPPLSDLAAPGARLLHRPAAALRRRPAGSADPDPSRPPLTASIDRWLTLYLRAHL